MHMSLAALQAHGIYRLSSLKMYLNAHIQASTGTLPKKLTLSQSLCEPLDLVEGFGLDFGGSKSVPEYIGAVGLGLRVHYVYPSLLKSLL